MKEGMVGVCMKSLRTLKYAIDKNAESTYSELDVTEIEDIVYEV